MSDATNLMLSAEEQLLVNKSDWILMKRDIMDKAVLLLSQLSVSIEARIKAGENFLPDEIRLSKPKISKGENYLGLPYALLDYPKYFDHENIFTIRTLFWWGNFFSITLHLSGSCKERFTEAIVQHVHYLLKDDWCICINEDQWQHHFEPINYLIATAIDREKLIRMLKQRPFIKIAQRFPLGSWNEMPAMLERAFSTLMEIIK